MSRRGVHPLSAQHTGGRSLETVGHMDPQPRDQSGSQSRGEQPTGAAASPQVRSSGNSSIQLFCSCFHHSNKRHGLIRAGGLGYPHVAQVFGLGPGLGAKVAMTDLLFYQVFHPVMHL